MTHLTEFQLNEYLDGELDEAERQSAAAHLAACADCREALADLQAVFFALDEVAEVELTTDLSARLLDDLQPQAAPAPWLRPLLLIQAAAIVGMIIWLWPTLRAWALTVETAVRLLQTHFSLSLPDLWTPVYAWGTATWQQIQLARPAIPLANNQWTLLIILALALWLTGNQLLLKDNA